VADLEGVEPALASPFGRRTDAVTHGTLDMWQRQGPTVLWRHHRRFISSNT